MGPWPNRDMSGIPHRFEVWVVRTQVGHGFKFSWDVVVGSHVGFMIFGGSENFFFETHYLTTKNFRFKIS